MKKALGWLVLSLFVAQGVAVASMDPASAKKAHYQEVKKIKDAQRMQREAQAKDPSVAKKNNGFWQREGERSGLGDSGNRFGNVMRSLNPAPFFKEQKRRYDERKNASYSAK